MKEWLRRTRGPVFELTRHFLARLFDSELFATPGEWVRVAAPALAAVLSAVVLIAPLYLQKYGLRTEQYRTVLGTTERLMREVRLDQQSMATLLAVVTAILTALLWQSLFPSVRDALALASLPVRPRQIFLAKFAAVTLLFGFYALALTVPFAALFAGITARLVPNLALHFLDTLGGWLGACAISFFLLFALQGLLLNTLPARIYRRASVWAQSLAFGAAIASIPLFHHLPRGGPNWPPPGWAVASAALLAVGIYAVSYHRYRTLLLETPVEPERERGRWRDALLRRCLADPAEQAMFAFLLQSLVRSRTHQFVLLALAALAVSMNIRVVSDTADPARELQFTVVFGPLTMAVVAIAGLRYLFSLPTELRANWLFRLSERHGRDAWLRAVERFVLVFGVGGSFLCWFPAAVWSLGVGAVIAYLPGVLLALVVFEKLFRGWSKAPFTCSYLPGKQPLWRTLLVFFYASWALGVASGILLAGVFYPPVFFLVVPILAVVWHRSRRRRLAEWKGRPLQYEDLPPPAMQRLELDNDSFASTATALGEPPEQELWSTPDGESRWTRAMRWLRDVPRDSAHALRGFRQRPGFAVGATVTIALGLGLNAAFFAIYDAYFLREVAVTDPGSLYAYTEQCRDPDNPRRIVEGFNPSMLQYRALQRRKDVFVETLARRMTMIRHQGRFLVGLYVSDNYFSMPGARAAMGRLIGPDDLGPVMVLGHRAWRGRFGADPTILGQTVDVRGVRFAIIGVAAPEFTGVATDAVPDFWVPLAAWHTQPNNERDDSVEVVARLKPNVGPEQANAALISQARQNRPERMVWAISFRQVATIAGSGGYSEFTFLILLTFAFTMAIPCANVANMMLARGIERQRALGVRMALGASRGRVVRQLLVEALAVALAGGVAGFFVARAALAAALRALDSTLPSLAYLRAARMPDLVVEERVFLYMLGVAVATSLVFALLPALESARWGASFALRRELAGVRSSWLRDALVVGQVAVCLMLIACSALLLRGTERFTRTNPGFDPNDLHVVATIEWNVSDAVEQSLRRQDWISGVARSSSMPHQLWELPVRDPSSAREFRLRHNTVSTDYLGLMAIPVVRGRNFTEHEAASKAAVAILSEAGARLLFPDGDPLGRVVRIDKSGVRGGLPKQAEFQVVGVVRERAQQDGVLTDAPRIYFPDSRARVAVVRGRGDTRRTSAQLERLLTGMRTETGMEVTLPVEDLLYLENYAARAALWVAVALGLVALVLTASGMYGVMSFLAGQRTREIGIRVALGATRTSVVNLMFRYSSRLVAGGLLIGVVLTVWIAKLIAARTIYIAVYDAPAYVAGLAVVGLVALLAAIPPAWRASRADPMATLRLD